VCRFDVASAWNSPPASKESMIVVSCATWTLLTPARRSTGSRCARSGSIEKRSNDESRCPGGMSSKV